jgi:hypothetical protein
MMSKPTGERTIGERLDALEREARWLRRQLVLRTWVMGALLVGGLLAVVLFDRWAHGLLFQWVVDEVRRP